MRTVLSAVACLVVLGASGAFAQQAADNLNETQRHGRQLLAQSCGVCHLSPSLNARTYDPPLNKAPANGDNTKAKRRDSRPGSGANLAEHALRTAGGKSRVA